MPKRPGQGRGYQHRKPYAKFVAEPLRGWLWPHTVGNSLSSGFCSSLAGKEQPLPLPELLVAQHEFGGVCRGIVEDVTDIVLNLKKISVLKAGS